MSRRHPEKGYYLCTTFQEKYPTGRKHCSDCKCWRPVSDFGVHTWTDSLKTAPHKLLAYCRRCAAIRQKAIRWRRKLPPRGAGRGIYWSRDFVRFLDRFITSFNPIEINGTRLAKSETKALWRWRTSEVETIRLSTADWWCIRFELPWWEILGEAAKMAAYGSY